MWSEYLSTWEVPEPFPDTVIDVIAEEDASMDIEGHRLMMSATFYN